MKKLQLAFMTLLLAIVPVLAWVSIGHAQRFSNKIDETQVVHGSVYSGGKNVEIKGIIYGDIFCGGQNITINATVYGDVICGGVDVTINGTVDGDIRVAGQTVAIGAQVGRNVTVLAASFSLDAEARVGQDVTATGDTMNIKGEVGRDVVASGANLYFNSKIGRNVSAQSEHIVLKDDARIAGNLTYSGNKEVERKQKAEVVGETKHTTPERKDSYAFSPMLFLFVLSGMTLISIVLAFFLPKFLQRMSDNARDNVGKTLLTGLGASVIVPGLAFALTVSVVGIPLGFFLLSAMFFAAVLSGPIAAYYIGRLLLRKSKNTTLIAVSGAVVLAVVVFLPFLGFVALFLAFFLGFGSIIIELQKHMKSSSAAKHK